MKKIFLMAAAAATLFASCAKEDNGQNGPGNDGASKVTLAFKVPTTAFATRANGDDQNAQDPAETKVNTVSVFIFDEGGTMATTGGFTQLVAADFATGAEGGYATYTQNKNYIATVSGDVIIYVGINLPAALDVEYTSETALLAAAEEMTGFADYDNQSFTMFSTAAAKPTLLDTTDEENPQEVPVTVERVASKVVGTTEKATFGAGDIPAWPNDVQLSYTIKGYNVYNEAIAGFMARQTPNLDEFDGDPVLNGFDASYAKKVDNMPMTAGALATDFNINNPLLTALAGDKVFYIGENKSRSAGYYIDEDGEPVPAAPGLSRVGNTTYAMVATQVTATKSAVWNAIDTKFEWTGPAITAGQDLAIIIVGGEPFIVVVGDKAAYTTMTSPTGTLATAGVTFKSYFYPAGMTHFLVWLNRTSANNAEIDRNQFVHLHVQGVKTLNGSGDPIFPGYPGDESDPDKPIDPTEDTNTNNPDPIQPEDPIDGAPAFLNVKVTVKPWVYMGNHQILD